MADVELPPMVMGLLAVLLAREVSERVPLLMATEPLVHTEELLPLSVSVPAPILVRSLPEVELVIVPLRVRSPLPPILDDDPNVILPAHVDAVPDPLIKAPPLEIPVPFNVIDSVAELVSENPFISSAPPDVMVVPLPVVPKGPEEDEVDEIPSFNVAFAFTVVESEYVLALDRVKDVPLDPPMRTLLAKVVVVEFVL